ncbi:Sec63-domain-containing protein [Ramicandelaber brevisporus]|nr:Sec63-domain-containing protein [Ramicandelaber brevisporus]
MVQSDRSSDTKRGSSSNNNYSGSSGNTSRTTRSTRSTTRDSNRNRNDFDRAGDLNEPILPKRRVDYRYETNANLVLRSNNPRNDASRGDSNTAATGEPTSLFGQVSMNDMGSRARADKSEAKERLAKARTRAESRRKATTALPETSTVEVIKTSTAVDGGDGKEGEEGVLMAVQFNDADDNEDDGDGEYDNYGDSGDDDDDDLIAAKAQSVLVTDDGIVTGAGESRLKYELQEVADVDNPNQLTDSDESDTEDSDTDGDDVDDEYAVPVVVGGTSSATATITATTTITAVSTAEVDGHNEPMQIDSTDEYTTDADVEVLDFETLMANLDLSSGEGGSSGSESLSVPAGTIRTTHQHYEEIHIPAPRQYQLQPKDKLISIDEMPAWTRCAFTGRTTLNFAQSTVYPAVFGTDENVLVSAPTSAGKTDIGLLAILRAVSHHISSSSSSSSSRSTGKVDIALDAFKVVYVAPMKALVREICQTLGRRLAPLGLTVAELTGDSQLSRERLAATNVIVTTPEKWDVTTRGGVGSERSHVKLVSLLILDEIHLLGDSRGPVLEAIVARARRQLDISGTYSSEPRIVGLSATLPNASDVALFIGIDPNQNVPAEERGLFVFDGSHRPCPLKMSFFGITKDKKARKGDVMDEIVYEQTKYQIKDGQQVLIFVHSRRDTGKVAQMLLNTAAGENELDTFIPQTESIVESKPRKFASPLLNQLAPCGIGIHHAGLNASDRAAVEDLFRDRSLRILVSTATLAWGVNLPAHCVIIRGTDVYSPELGGWTHLSHQDTLQMLGRAGRPGLDTFGEGIIVTDQKSMRNQYLHLFTASGKPIESKLLTRITDCLNAEIARGSICNRDEAADWLQHTYYFIRMVKEPARYGISRSAVASGGNHQMHLQRRLDIAHTAATLLAKAGLIKYDAAAGNSGRFTSTPLGRIAASYYISPESMSMLRSQLKSQMSHSALMHVFAQSSEFSNITLRSEEHLELSRLLDRIPIPIPPTLHDTPASKIMVLLQAYISRVQLGNLALAADMVFIAQNAARLMRAMFEVCLARKWSQMALMVLDMCKAVELRTWSNMSPLRQMLGKVNGLSPDTVLMLERLEVSPEQLRRLDEITLIELVKTRIGNNTGSTSASASVASGQALYTAIHALPRVEVAANIQPISRGLLRIEITVIPRFDWLEAVHSRSEMFWVVCSDCDSNNILHCEQLQITPPNGSSSTNNSSEESDSPLGEYVVSFTVSLPEPMQPCYFVDVVSDRWLKCGTRIAVSFRNLVLPSKEPKHTPLTATERLPLVTSLNNAAFAKAFKIAWDSSSDALQSQVFDTAYKSDHSMLVCSPSASGKTAIAELALMRLWSQKIQGRISSSAFAVCLLPSDRAVQQRASAWRAQFAHISTSDDSNITIAALCDPVSGGGTSTVDIKADYAAISTANVVVATPERWDLLSRKWRSLPRIRDDLALVIADDLDTVGSLESPLAAARYEQCIIRTRIMSQDKQVRIVGLSVCIANASDVAGWIGVTSAKHVFSFSPLARSLPFVSSTSSTAQALETRIQGFTNPHFTSMMMAMSRPVFQALHSAVGDNPATRSPDAGNVIVFVPSRQQCVTTAAEIAQMFATVNDRDASSLTKRNVPIELVEAAKRISDRSLQSLLPSGIAFIHDAVPSSDVALALSMYSRGFVRILFACAPDWSASYSPSHNLSAKQVILMGTQRFHPSSAQQQSQQQQQQQQQQRYTDYSAFDIQRLLGFARRSALILCPDNRRSMVKTALTEAPNVESVLSESSALPNVFLAEISSGEMNDMQSAIDYLTWTLFYRRLTKNPNYYGMLSRSRNELESFLSGIVEDTTGELEDAACLLSPDDVDSEEEEEDDEDGGNSSGGGGADQAMRLRLSDLGRLATTHNVQVATIDTIELSFKPSTKFAGLLEILSAASEFESICAGSQMDHVSTLRQVHALIPLKLRAFNTAATSSAMITLLSKSHARVFILLQAHLSRISLPSSLVHEQRAVVRQARSLLRAFTAMFVSKGWLNLSTLCITLLQMLTQALWVVCSELLQIPHFTADMIRRVQSISPSPPTSVYGVVELDDNVRDKLLSSMDKSKRIDMASFVNNLYPDTSLKYELFVLREARNGKEVKVPVTQKGITVYVDDQLELQTFIRANDSSPSPSQQQQQQQQQQQHNHGFAQYARYGSNPMNNEKVPLEWWILVSMNKGVVEAGRRVVADCSAGGVSKMITIEFQAPSKAGEYTVEVSALCSAYIGCDMHEELLLKVEE